MLSELTLKTYTEMERKIKNNAPLIVWFILVAVVVYAFYCTARGYDFGIIANPFKLGCYK